MQRRQWYECFERCHYFAIDADWLGIAGAAVHHPVPDSHHRRSVCQRSDRPEDLQRCCAMVERRPALFCNDFVLMIHRMKTWRDPDLLDLAAKPGCLVASGLI